MENDICLAYTFIEFNKNFDTYYNQSSKYEDQTERAAKARWRDIKIIYKKMSKFMSDESIIQAQKAVMELY